MNFWAGKITLGGNGQASGKLAHMVQKRYYFPSYIVCSYAF